MTSARTMAARSVALTAVIAAAVPALASENVAIYTNIPGHPTAQVPGVPGEEFRSPLVPFLTLYGSPIGHHWIFKAFTDNPDFNDVIVAGSFTTGQVVAKEKIELRSTCNVQGEIQAKSVAIAEGGFFEGKVHMTAREGAAMPTTFRETRNPPTAPEEAPPEKG